MGVQDAISITFSQQYHMKQDDTGTCPTRFDVSVPYSVHRGRRHTSPRRQGGKVAVQEEKKGQRRGRTLAQDIAIDHRGNRARMHTDLCIGNARDSQSRSRTA